MAGGDASDFRIYNREFFSGMTEVIMQNTNAFNAASNGSILLTDETIPGDFVNESFFKSITTGLISRRDPESISGVTDGKLEQGENSAVKLHRRIGPIANTRSSFLEIGESPEEMSFILGQQFAAALIQEQLNTCLGALNAAISNQSALLSNLVTATTKTISSRGLNSGLRLFGDQANQIVAWVMHSSSYFDLVDQAIADKVFEEAGLVVYGGSPGTLGRPVVISDSSNLIDTTPTPDTYSILGLTPGAIEAVNTQDRYVTAFEVTGQENISIRIQGEYAYNLKMKGYTWDTTNGGKNPTAAAVNTGTNWDKTSTDNKSTAGIVIDHQLL